MFKIFNIFILLAVCAFSFFVAQAAIGVPKILNYQGRLLDANGNLLGGAGTQYCFRFSIYDNPTVGSGNKLWPSSTSSAMTATVRSGVFSVGVGDVSAGGDALTFNFQDNDTVYLNVEVATKIDALCTGPSQVFENLNPRQQIVASGYAINSLTVGGFAPAQLASGSQIPVLTAGNLFLGGVNPQINATGTNTLTLQGGAAATGSIQFFSSGNFITSTGTLTLAGALNSLNVNQYLRTTSTPTFAGLTVSSTITGNILQLAASSNQLVFQSGGASGTISWTPSAARTLTIPDFSAASDTVATLNFAQTLSNKTLNAPSVIAGLTLIQNNPATGFTLLQNATGTALAIINQPTSTQATSTVSIVAGANVSGRALLVNNFGSGNAFEVQDASAPVFTVYASGTITIQASSDATGTLRVKNTAGTETLLSVDTINDQVNIGNDSAAGTPTTLLGLDAKADAGDPTGFNGAMYYSSSTGQFRCFQNGIWYNCVPTNMDWQPIFLKSKWGYLAPTGVAATVFTAVNMIAITPNGTAAASAQAEDFYVQWTSGAVSGNVGGITPNTFAQTQMRYTPRAATRIRTDVATTTRRIWFALNSAAITGTDGTGALGTTYIGIRFSTAAGDTTWQCASGDGTTGSVLDTGVPVAASTYYDFIFDATVPGQLTCKIATNGGSYVSVTKSTNVSTSSVNLGVTDAATTLAASAIIHRSAYVYVGGR